MEQRDVNELTVGYTQRSVPLPGASLAAADHASHAAGSWICFSPHQFPPHRKRHGMRLVAALVEAERLWFDRDAGCCAPRSKGGTTSTGGLVPLAILSHAPRRLVL